MVVAILLWFIWPSESIRSKMDRHFEAHNYDRDKINKKIALLEDYLKIHIVETPDKYEKRK